MAIHIQRENDRQPVLKLLSKLSTEYKEKNVSVSSKSRLFVALGAEGIIAQLATPSEDKNWCGELPTPLHMDISGPGNTQLFLNSSSTANCSRYFGRRVGGPNMYILAGSLSSEHSFAGFAG